MNGSGSSSAPGRLVPTPRVSDAGLRGGTTGYGLRDRSRSLLPTTPRATDGTHGGPNQRGSSGDLMLPSAVMELLPTPQASLGRGTGTPSPETAAERFGQGKRNLDDAVALLPTPSVAAATGGQRSRGGDRQGEMLVGGIVQTLLPTPTAMDAHGSGGNSPANVTLTDAVVRTSLGASTNPRFDDGNESSDGQLQLPLS